MSWSSPAITDVMQYVAPSSGATVTANQGVTSLLLDPGGTLAALTVNLPANPTDGQRFTVSSSAVITVLTLSGNGNTLKGGIASLSLNGFAKYTFSAAGNAWFRTG